MDEQQQTTATPTEPKLCKMGCGFFGSNATGDCCSKCWNDLQKKEGAPAPAVAAPAPRPPSPTLLTQPVTEATASPMVVEPAAAEATAEPAPVPSPTKKKKKKKMGYKAMMAAMTEGSGERSAAEEKKSIEKVTGGGAFMKIDKI